jgi:hypothetical protein
MDTNTNAPVAVAIYLTIIYSQGEYIKNAA